MNAHNVEPARRRGRSALVLSLLLVASLAWAQKIDDIPPAVKNNVAPNFMFMVDNSGSMNNVVPAAPYSASATYLNNCTGNARVPAGTSVDLRVVSGVPRIRYNNTNYQHTTQSGNDTARCFVNTATYSARLLADDTSGNTRLPGSYLDSEYSGHFLNWYFGVYGGPETGWVDRKRLTTGAVQSRMEIARTSANSVINSLPLPSVSGVPAVRVGLSTYRSAGGQLLVGMRDLTTTSRAAITSAITNLDPSGNTPLASTFADIGRYMGTGYVGDVVTANGTVGLDALLRLSGSDNSTARNACLGGAPSCTSSSSTKPIQYWCQSTALFAMTDGRPQGDRSFNNNDYLRDYDGDCSGSNSASCVGGGSAGNWDRKVGRTYESIGSDYMDDVAKALFDIDLRPDLSKPTRTPPAKNNITTYMIGFADPTVQNDPLLINTARQGGGRFIAATDGPTLVSAFQSVIADALAKDASSAAVSVTNALVSAGTVGYASSYNSGSWYGDLEAYSLDTSTGLQTGPVQWSAREKLNARTADSRKIATWSGSDGVPFTTAQGSTLRSITPGLTDALIDYTRGDRTGEGTTFRARNHLLGDIINAEPVVVNYSGGAVVYQAANDGLLHAFDGRIESTANTRGQELWAYVPALVHGKLAARASPTMLHEYLVDGTPATAEVTGVGSVGRILVGGLNKGGAGYYALDITTSAAANEAAVANKVLWEFKPANMGYSYGLPLIVRTAAGWRVVVASGLRNDTEPGGLGGDGRGRVWVLDPANGNIEKEFVTPAGFGSAGAALGLAHLGTLANAAPDALVRHVYGGDLQGNLWRFDLDAPTLSAPVQLAAVTAPNGTAQPISSPPVVGPVSGSSTKYWVYFGTGQYFSSDDVPGTASPNAYATQVGSFYGLIDDTSVAAPALPNIRGSNGASCPTGGGSADFVCQSATRSSSDAPFEGTRNAVNTTTRRGFYMDIPVSAGRVNTAPALTRRGTLLFVVNQPTNETCNPGGYSFLFQLDGATGGAVLRTAGGGDYYPVGASLADALSSRPVVITTSSGTRALTRHSDRTTESSEVYETGGTAATFRRIYMRPLN